MEYTQEQISEMEEYLVSQLKMHTNNTYPTEERVLSLLLVAVKDLKVSSSNAEKASLEVEA